MGSLMDTLWWFCNMTLPPKSYNSYGKSNIIFLDVDLLRHKTQERPYLLVLLINVVSYYYVEVHVNIPKGERPGARDGICRSGREHSTRWKLRDFSGFVVRWLMRNELMAL
jgi:hypothetical protein